MKSCANCGWDKGFHADYCSAGQRRAEPRELVRDRDGCLALAIGIVVLVACWAVFLVWLTTKAMP